MLLTDTHCHLNLNQFNSDLEVVLDRARQAGVTRLLVPGIDVKTSKKAIALAENHSDVYAAVGIHPNIGIEWNPADIAAIEKLAAHPKVAALGEIGLDNHWKETDPALQVQILLAQLDIARRVNKPVVLHSREALVSLWPILQRWSAELSAVHSTLEGRLGVLHSYEGDLDLAEKARTFGFFISLAGPVTYPNASEKHALAVHHPLENLLIETDSPYLSPQTHRGQRNEPANVVLVAAKIAEVRKMDVAKVAEMTSMNAAKLFNWSY